MQRPLSSLIFAGAFVIILWKAARLRAADCSMKPRCEWQNTGVDDDGRAGCKVGLPAREPSRIATISVRPCRMPFAPEGM
jgi:hypothetical protein